jgi:hypothetical protein
VISCSRYLLLLLLLVPLSSLLLPLSRIFASHALLERRERERERDFLYAS